MFHRVKSETQEFEKQEVSQPPKAPAQKLQEQPRQEARQERPGIVADQPRPQPIPQSIYKTVPANNPSSISTHNFSGKREEQAMNQSSDNTVTASGSSQNEAADRSDQGGEFGQAGNRHNGVAGNQGNSYQSAAYAPAPSARVLSSPKTKEGSSLTISQGITMSGEIEACDHLVVEGTVEAALKGARILDIEESGVFYGTIEIEEATIAGRFEGDIVVSGRLKVKSTGIITGSITYRELEAESGAIIDGRLTPLSAVPIKGQKDDKHAKANSGERSSEGFSPANSDGQLFAERVKAAE